MCVKYSKKRVNINAIFYLLLTRKNTLIDFLQFKNNEYIEKEPHNS